MDKLGVAYEAPTVATGFGAYLALVRFFCCSADNLLFHYKMYLKPLLYELITYACVFAALDEGDDREQGRAHKG